MRFVNALAQSLGPSWRVFMKSLNRALDTRRKVLDEQDIDDLDGADDVSMDEGDAVDEALYGLLVDKTEGEAALRVSSGEPGHGLQAYMRVFVSFPESRDLPSRR